MIGQIRALFDKQGTDKLKAMEIAKELNSTPDEINKALIQYDIYVQKLGEFGFGYEKAQFDGVTVPEVKTDNLPSTLVQLAADINANERILGQQKEAMVKTAIDSGLKLIQAKEYLPHGEFQSWVSANCSVNYRQANKYMKIAGEYGGKSELSALLDVNTEVKLLMFDDTEAKSEAEQSDREFMRDLAQDMTQKERDKLLKQIEKFKEEANRNNTSSEGWRSDAVKYREELRKAKEEAEALKKQLAEKPKAVYITDNDEALRQATEAYKQQAADAKEQATKLKKSYQEDVKKGIERKVSEENGITQRIRELELMQAKAEKDYHDFLNKKARALQADKLRDKIKELFHQGDVSLHEIFHDEEPWTAEQMRPIMHFVKLHMGSYAEALRLFEAREAEEQSIFMAGAIDSTASLQ